MTEKRPRYFDRASVTQIADHLAQLIVETYGQQSGRDLIHLVFDQCVRGEDPSSAAIRQCVVVTTAIFNILASGGRVVIADDRGGSAELLIELVPQLRDGKTFYRMPRGEG